MAAQLNEGTMTTTIKKNDEQPASENLKRHFGALITAGIENGVIDADEASEIAQDKWNAKTWEALEEIARQCWVKDPEDLVWHELAIECYKRAHPESEFRTTGSGSAETASGFSRTGTKAFGEPESYTAKTFDEFGHRTDSRFAPPADEGEALGQLLPAAAANWPGGPQEGERLAAQFEENDLPTSVEDRRFAKYLASMAMTLKSLEWEEPGPFTKLANALNEQITEVELALA